jgi:hypothetical protein
MSTLEVKELSHPSGEVIKIAAGKTLDLNSQGTLVLPTIPHAKMPSGSVLQVVQITSVVQSTSTTGSDVDLFTAAITPSSTSSKILVSTTIFHGKGNDETFYMSRNGTKIAGVGSGGTSYISVGSFYNSDNSVARDTATMASLSYEYLDSPSSTSEVTYKIGHMSPSSGPAFYINRAVTAGQGFGRSTLTLMEIAG